MRPLGLIFFLFSLQPPTLSLHTSSPPHTLCIPLHSSRAVPLRSTPAPLPSHSSTLPFHPFFPGAQGQQAAEATRRADARSSKRG